LCQFHIIKAIGKADFSGESGMVSDTDDEEGKRKRHQKGKAKQKGKKGRGSHTTPLAVSLRARQSICTEFRKIQRYRGRKGESWDEYYTEFQQGLERIGVKYSIELAVPAILEYFDRNWFCDRWRCKWLTLHETNLRLTIKLEALALDEGLPKGQTRDGPWNTNNSIESAFRTLNVVFLECRRNKRFVLFNWAK
jgi:hypothetical protein